MLMTMMMMVMERCSEVVCVFATLEMHTNNIIHNWCSCTEIEMLPHTLNVSHARVNMLRRRRLIVCTIV